VNDVSSTARAGETSTTLHHHYFHPRMRARKRASARTSPDGELPSTDAPLEMREAALLRADMLVSNAIPRRLPEVALGVDGDAAGDK